MWTLLQKGAFLPDLISASEPDLNPPAVKDKFCYFSE